VTAGVFGIGEGGVSSPSSVPSFPHSLLREKSLKQAILNSQLLVRALTPSDYSEEALAQWDHWLTAEADREKECFVSLKHEDEGSP